MNAGKIDSAILATASGEWQKVAMLIARVATANQATFTDDEDDFELVAMRNEALIASGHLIADGDTSDWRRSEVKLPQQLVIIQ